MAPRRDSSSIIYQQEQQQQQQLYQSQQEQHLSSLLWSTATIFRSNDANDELDITSPPLPLPAPSSSAPTATTHSAISVTNSEMSPMQPIKNATAVNDSGASSGTVAAVIANNIHNNNNSNSNINDEQYTQCCQPNGDCAKSDSLISLDDLRDCVHVICNNENCNVGQYMHRECFDTFEQSVLVYLKSNTRACCWSDRVRAQNVWTKKGYDMVYKACLCKCGVGHLRKDLEWVPPTTATTAATSILNKSNAIVNCQNTGSQRNIMNNNSNTNSNLACHDGDDEKKKKKKRNRSYSKRSVLSLASPNSNINNNNNSNMTNGINSGGQQTQQQQQLQQQIANNMNNNSSNGNTAAITIHRNNANNNNGNSNGVTNNIPTNPNVGVIGSGLPHNLNNHHNVNQQQFVRSDAGLVALETILNGNGTGIVGVGGGGGGNVLGLDVRVRAGSLSSGDSSGSTSPSASHSSCDNPISPILTQDSLSPPYLHQHLQQQQQLQQQMQQYQKTLVLQQQQQQQQNGLTKSILNGINGCVTNGVVNGGVGGIGEIENTNALAIASLLSKNQHQQISPDAIMPPAAAALMIGGVGGGGGVGGSAIKPLHHHIIDQQQLLQQQKNKEVEMYSERVRSTSGCNGIFSRRLDFSSFNLLPKTRLNSYQVKIEDEGNHGNDETRLFILSSLAQSQMSRVACILCEEPMLVFDRYPLVDGSFFLSPKQHSTGCIEVKYEGRTMFLTCVCMSCLDGTSANRIISCRFCGELWNGSNLVLGTMYAYDIFAAMPCCVERLKCNNCFKLLLHPQQRLNFYSDYSHCVTCPYCTTQDTHFVKPLNFCYTRSSSVRLGSIA